MMADSDLWAKDGILAYLLGFRVEGLRGTSSEGLQPI